MKRNGRIDALAATLSSTTDILRGSLLQRRIRHRSGCAVCARGEGHLISVLTVSYPGGRSQADQPPPRTETHRPTVAAQLSQNQSHPGAHL